MRNVIKVDGYRVLTKKSIAFDPYLCKLLFVPPTLLLPILINYGYLVDTALLMWFIDLSRDDLVQTHRLCLSLNVFLPLNGNFNWLKKFRCEQPMPLPRIFRLLLAIIRRSWDSGIDKFLYRLVGVENPTILLFRDYDQTFVHAIEKFWILFALDSQLHVQLRDVTYDNCDQGSEQKDGQSQEHRLDKSDQRQTLSVYERIWGE